MLALHFHDNSRLALLNLGLCIRVMYGGWIVPFRLSSFRVASFRREMTK